jgi:hypothetical protein
MLYKRVSAFVFFTLSFAVYSLAQENAVIYGVVTDAVTGKPMPSVNIIIKNSGNGVKTDNEGKYKIESKPGIITLIFSSVGYKTLKSSISLARQEKQKIDQKMEEEVLDLQVISVTGKSNRGDNLTNIEVKDFKMIPNTSGNFETILKTLPGVYSNNELSSQYSVRGGNFDENLVYVNDIEIYRPLLIRSGQQEGLSFIDPEMVSSVKFSAGGFDAKYGDKMSSVLDVTYKKPIQIAGTASVSLLGESVNFEGVTKNQRFTWNTGFRYKTSQYLLNSLQTKGDYRPSFSDIQAFLTYQLSDKLSLNVLGNYARNKYQFVPQTRETTFGTYTQVYNLTIYYDGQEIDSYDTYQGALSAIYQPTKDVRLKLIAAAYDTHESETYDIQGQYRLNEIDEQGDSTSNLGIGTYLNHARNYIDATVFSLSHTGSYNGDNKVKWGINGQAEKVNEKINEWNMTDSADYSTLTDYTNTKIDLNSLRFTSFIQGTRSFDMDKSKLMVTAGVRSNYWNFNHQLLISPRASIELRPDWERTVNFRFATGLYYQPPFYKELTNVYGNVNYNIKAQKSIHFVLGSDYSMKLWDRQFVWTTEVYYKKMTDLIPYKIDNVRVIYSAENSAHGYAGGIDIKINGEFVEGVESWAGLSFMQTKEKSYYYSNGVKVNTGYYPRPTDQLFNFTMFFQDYLPHNPSYKVHLMLTYGSGLPYNLPNKDRYDLTFRTPGYERVDMGFSKMLKGENQNTGFLKFFKSVWLSGEIYNLFGVNNVISYMWVKTVATDNTPAGEASVPNYLTSRRLNLKLTMKI